MQRVYRLFPVIILFVLLLLGYQGYAQHSAKCGFGRTLDAVVNANPGFSETYNAIRSGEYNNRSSSKGTVDITNPVIPVVFHVVLTEGQLTAMGGRQKVEERIAAQMDVINRDFNAQNADSVDIPAGFKTVYGNSGFSFALAHTAPDGSSTPGYEIVITNRNGFNLEGGWGSGFGFSGAKYYSGGGVNAWDVESYLNIWVINPLENAAATNILGLSVPAYLTQGNNGIPGEEEGIVLHYGVLGNRLEVPGVYLSGSDRGRTLTHEIGHHFELLHTWGDDEGKCPDRGGADDGIADTPPQAYPSSGCNSYPAYDGCTRDGDGIMFMNYMDYSDDRCLLMFTNNQVDRMRQSIQPGANAYSLTQRPWLLNYPDAASTAIDNNFVLYPNPADNILNISFSKQSVGLNSIYIVDIAGRLVKGVTYERQSSFYAFQTEGLQAGLYFVVFDFDAGQEVRKILVR